MYQARYRLTSWTSFSYTTLERRSTASAFLKGAFPQAPYLRNALLPCIVVLHAGITKVAALLKDSGKFVLSIDKNKDRFIDTGTRKITVFPDTPAEIKSYIANSGLLIIELYETEFAHIFIAEKPDCS